MADSIENRLGRKIKPLRAGAEEDVAVDSAAMYTLLPVRPRELIASIPEFFNTACRHPTNLFTLLGRLSSDQVGILAGNSILDVAAENDRFRDDRWQSSGYHRRLAQGWLSLGQRMGEWIRMADLEPEEEKRLEFFLKTILSSLSPANFAATNPEVIENVRKTRGVNLAKGVMRLWRDIRNNHGLPTQVDNDLFEVGGNLAMTPGKVVYRNGVLELIQFAPTTAKVYKTPILLVSSYINRSYIFDLMPGRSTAENLVSQGYSVFMVSWNNPGVEMRDTGLDDYVEAVIGACDAARNVSGASSLNLTGLCGGGQMCTLAASVLQSRRKRWINSLTLMSYVIDPNPIDTDPGVLCTDGAVAMAKRELNDSGLYTAATLNWTLNLLQSERLLWSTVVDYYLLGKDPSASEVMFWTNDQVNVPAELACQLLDITLENSLAAGTLEVLGTQVDLKRLRMDNYQLASYHDHLMPWHGMHRNAELLGGNSEFVLTNGGHITPCITMPGNKRSRYFVSPNDTDDPQDWLDGASEKIGSWLEHWQVWLAERSGEKVKAPADAGNKYFPVLCDAPGEYVYK